MAVSDADDDVVLAASGAPTAVSVSSEREWGGGGVHALFLGERELGRIGAVRVGMRRGVVVVVDVGGRGEGAAHYRKLVRSLYKGFRVWYDFRLRPNFGGIAFGYKIIRCGLYRENVQRLSLLRVSRERERNYRTHPFAPKIVSLFRKRERFSTHSNKCI